MLRIEQRGLICCKRISRWLNCYELNDNISATLVIEVTNYSASGSFNLATPLGSLARKTKKSIRSRSAC